MKTDGASSDFIEQRNQFAACEDTISVSLAHQNLLNKYTNFSQICNRVQQTLTPPITLLFCHCSRTTYPPSAITIRSIADRIIVAMSTRYMTAMLALAASASVTAFAPIQPFRRSAQTQNTALQVSWWDSDDESHRAAMLNNILRTDLRNFLTQRSLQSFMHLCVQCRDPHTVKWLEEFGDLQNLENYHGTGALNVTKFPTWSSFLTDLMEHPEDVVVVSAKRRDRGNKGFRSEKENPYVKVSLLLVESLIKMVVLVR